MRFITEMLKGSPNHQVLHADGTEFAHAHCVNVKAQLFTLVVEGKWCGVMSEADAIAKLQAMV